MVSISNTQDYLPSTTSPHIMALCITSKRRLPEQIYCHAKPRQEPRPGRGRFGAQTRPAKAAAKRPENPAPMTMTRGFMPATDKRLGGRSMAAPT